MRASLMLTLVATCITAGLAPAVTASAADDPRSCVSIADDASRLACYDRALGHVPAAKPSAAAKSPVAPAGAAATAVARPAPAPAAAAKDPVAEFGLTEEAKAAKDPVKAAEVAAAPQSITARVVSVRLRKFGEFVVTLDNGQVWEQNEPQPAAIVKVGDTVSIKKALFGSYTLVTAGRIGTKVHRVD